MCDCRYCVVNKYRFSSSLDFIVFTCTFQAVSRPGLRIAELWWCQSLHASFPDRHGCTPSTQEPQWWCQCPPQRTVLIHRNAPMNTSTLLFGWKICRPRGEDGRPAERWLGDTATWTQWARRDTWRDICSPGKVLCKHTESISMLWNASDPDLSLSFAWSHTFPHPSSIQSHPDIEMGHLSWPMTHGHYTISSNTWD